LTVPLPDPLGFEVIAIHASLLTAVHVHPGPAVTEKLPVPPEEVKLTLEGLIEYVHPPPPPDSSC
jgi:hypothetical protein